MDLRNPKEPVSLKARQTLSREIPAIISAVDPKVDSEAVILDISLVNSAFERLSAERRYPPGTPRPQGVDFTR